jgi:hypothetical protein
MAGHPFFDIVGGEIVWANSSSILAREGGGRNLTNEDLTGRGRGDHCCALSALAGRGRNNKRSNW